MPFFGFFSHNHPFLCHDRLLTLPLGAWLPFTSPMHPFDLTVLLASSLHLPLRWWCWLLSWQLRTAAQSEATPDLCRSEHVDMCACACCSWYLRLGVSAANLRSMGVRWSGLSQPRRHACGIHDMVVHCLPFQQHHGIYNCSCCSYYEYSKLGVPALQPRSTGVR